MITTEQKEKLVKEYNNLENRQREILGALKLLDEIEKAEELPVKNVICNNPKNK